MQFIIMFENGLVIEVKSFSIYLTNSFLKGQDICYQGSELKSNDDLYGNDIETLFIESIIDFSNNLNHKKHALLKSNKPTKKQSSAQCIAMYFKIECLVLDMLAYLYFEI